VSSSVSSDPQDLSLRTPLYPYFTPKRIRLMSDQGKKDAASKVSAAISQDVVMDIKLKARLI